MNSEIYNNNILKKEEYKLVSFYLESVKITRNY